MKPQQCKALRASAGLTQQGLADKLGVARETVARYETGERNISTPMAMLIERVIRETRAETRAKKGGKRRR